MAGNAPHIPGCRDLSLIGERVARSLFSAISDRVGRPVTVTVFPPLSEGRTREQFDRAAATAQRLGAHPSVVTIHEWGHAGDGRPWVVTDPQPAESVDTQLTMDGPLEVERALQVGVLLAGALETAHRAGIVHGDLSPARLVFGAHGEPLLAETGLAPFAVLPGLGALNNPVRYHAPPEVLERTDTSPATDVYSLATTVYALLAGRAPQQKPAEITDSNASLLLRILQMPVPPIDRPDLPPGLFEALRGPLAPSPDKRPQQAIEVAWLLQDAQRRAGLAITEPVVLDLDEIDGAAAGRGTGTAGAVSRLPAPPPSALSVQPGSQAASQTGPAAGAAAPRPAPPAPAVPRPAATGPAAPLAAGAFPAAALPSPGDDAQAGDPWALPAEVFSFSEPDPPPPTIFPFAGDDAARPPASAVAFPPAVDDDAGHAPPPPTSDEAAPWSASASVTAPDDAPSGMLWPASWPGTGAGTGTDQPLSSAPDGPWAAEPPGSPPAADSRWPSAAPWASETPSSADVSSPTDPPSTADEPSPTDPPWAAGTPSPTDPPSTAGTPSPTDPPWAAGTPSPTDSPWGAAGAASATPSGALWPSAWPADAERPADELPPWAASPPEPDVAGAGPPGPGGPPVPAGGDGGSISDHAGLAGNGSTPTGDAAPPPSFPVPRPPELDELPAWYTDPLPGTGTPPNGPAAPSGHGNAGSNGQVAPASGGGGTPGEATGGGHAGGIAGDQGAPGSNGTGNGQAPPRRPAGSAAESLPGAGDELRSLFGEVVGDGDEAPPARGPDRPPPPGWQPPEAGPVPAPADDPLGPPSSRPPIDLSRLDTPLGPAPFLAPPSAAGAPPSTAPAPPSGGAPSTAERPPPGDAPTGTEPSAQPTRLPRRHEVQSWTPAPSSGGTQRLPRAGDRPAERPGSPDAAAGPRPAAGPSGPPALPLIVLIAVVAVLVAGVAWLVLTGDDSPPPASDRPAAGADGDASTADGTGGGTAPAAPTGVQIGQSPEGMQVTWSAPAGDYVVTVMAADQAPKTLPPAPGPSVLVPNSDLGQGGAWCFTVAAAPTGAAGEPGPPSEAVCTPGATVEAMRGA